MDRRPRPTPPLSDPGRTSRTAEVEAERAVEAADGLPTPRRYWAVLTVWLALFMAVLDGAVANVALPTIGAQLGARPAVSIWIVNAYQLAITVALLPLASLGDKIGYRRVYVAGLSLFTAGSLACALSHSLGELVAARVAQGFGAAGIMSINAALVRFTYPHRMLGRAIGWNAVVISIAAAAGPTIASAILAAADWRWLFAINVPVGVAAVAIAVRALPRPPATGAPLDFVSAGLNAAAFGGLILGIESLMREGPAVGLPWLLVGVVGLALLIRRQLALPAPMLPLDLLRIPPFRLAILASATAFTAQMLAFVALPFHFEGPLGRSAVETGLLMTPWPVAVGLAAPIAGRLADRVRSGVLGGLGLAMFAAGLALLATAPAHATDVDVVWRMALCGAGFGFFQSPNNRTIVSSAPRPRSGAAGGVLAMARLIGQTAGAVAMAGLFHAALGWPTHVALAAAAGIAVVAAVVSGLQLRLPGAAGQSRSSP